MRKHLIRHKDNSLTEIVGDICLINIPSGNVYENYIYTYSSYIEEDFSDIEIFYFTHDDISNIYTLVYDVHVPSKVVTLKRIDPSNGKILYKDKVIEVTSKFVELGHMNNLEEAVKTLLNMITLKRKKEK